MNDAAVKLIKESVLRALAKSPRDVEYYREQANDLSRPEAFRRAVDEALQEWRRTGSIPNGRPRRS